MVWETFFRPLEHFLLNGITLLMVVLVVEALTLGVVMVTLSFMYLVTFPTVLSSTILAKDSDCYVSHRSLHPIDVARDCLILFNDSVNSYLLLIIIIMNHTSKNFVLVPIYLFTVIGNEKVLDPRL